MNVQYGALKAAESSPDYERLLLPDRVHGSVYTDPRIFEDEMERIFHRGWVFVGHESEIPEKGDFRARSVGRQPVIFVRGDDGEVRVLMNRCTHRGSVVCPHERGSTRHFTCAYHGWSFRNTGELAGVPGEDRYGPGFAKADHGLRRAPRQGAYRGLVFASLAPEGPSLDEHLGPLAKAEIDVAFDLSPVGEFEVNAGVHKYGYAGNWKLQAENSCDAYHVGYLHRSYFRLIKDRTGIDVSVDDGGGAVARSLGNGHVTLDSSMMGHQADMVEAVKQEGWPGVYAARMIEAYGEDRARRLLSRRNAHVLIFPNLVLIAAQIRVIRPIAVDQTEVFIYPMILKGVPPEVNRERLRVHEAFYGPAGGGATDDLEVFERVTTGLRATVDPWVLLGRGVGREWIDEAGATVGEITDELPNRAILAQWRKMLLDGAP